MITLESCKDRTRYSSSSSSSSASYAGEVKAVEREQDSDT